MKRMSRSPLKWLGVFLFWVLALAYLVCDGAGNNRLTCAPISSWAEACLRYERGVLQSVKYVQWSEGRDSAPLFLMQFEELSTDSGHAGPFRTSLYNVARIKSLHVQLFPQPEAPSHPKSGGDARKGGGATLLSLPQSPSVLLRRYTSLASDGLRTGQGVSLKADLPCLNDIAHVEIHGFAWDVVEQGACTLQVHCRRALLHPRDNCVGLRGHVRISTADGTVLESNRVLWHPDKRRFRVEGGFLLTQDGRRSTGSGIWFDERLRPVQQTLAFMDSTNRR